jgi:hypothetical protein
MHCVLGGVGIELCLAAKPLSKTSFAQALFLLRFNNRSHAVASLGE